MKKILLLGLLLSCPAWAGMQTQSVTVGTTSASGLPTNYTGMPGQFTGSVSVYYFHNESTTASLACKFDPNTLPTAALNTSGNITLGPGGEKWFILTNLSNGFVACIASASSTPMTVIVQ